jgi:hypothetical protein
MTLARPALCLALVASLATAGAAAAVTKPKPKPVCNLITDGPGDASLQAPIPSDDSLDVVSGDLASDAKNVTAVIRVKDLGATSPAALTGRNYYFLFSVPTAVNPIYFSYESDATGETGNFGALVPDDTTGVGSYTRSGAAVATLVPEKNEIHITVPVSAVNGLGKITPGTKVSGMNISTTDVVGVIVFDADTAEASKSYVAGALSCVKPGK